MCDVNKNSDSGYWNDGPGGRDRAKAIAGGVLRGPDGLGRVLRGSTFTAITATSSRATTSTRCCALLPDHWHALPVIEAAESGKDIYGEKPLALTIHEGRLMADAVKKNRRVFQCGSQQRSDQRFRFACELVRNGAHR